MRIATSVLTAFAALFLVMLSLLSSPSIQPSVASAASRPWPMFHQNAQHTGLSPFPGPAVPFLKWKFRTGGAIYSSVAIGSGRVYVGSYDGNLYALNLQGVLLWKFQSGSPIKTTPAIGSDGTIYLASCIECHFPLGHPEGILYAINPSGKLKWNLTIANTGEGESLLSSPTIGPDGTIYTSSLGFRTIAVNPNGTLKWELATGGEVFDSPAIGPDGTLYVAIDDANPSPGLCGFCLVALNPDGTLKWSIDGQLFGSAVVGTDGTIYAGNDAINPDGSVKWRISSIASIDAIGSDGTIYASGNGSLYAFNLDGTLKWQFSGVRNGGVCTPAGCSSLTLVEQSWASVDSNGTAYFGSGVTYFVNGTFDHATGSLYSVAPNGIPNWNFTITSNTGPCPLGFVLTVSDLAIGSNETVYVGSDDGNLYAIGNSR